MFGYDDVMFHAYHIVQHTRYVLYFFRITYLPIQYLHFTKNAGELPKKIQTYVGIYSIFILNLIFHEETRATHAQFVIFDFSYESGSK